MDLPERLSGRVNSRVKNALNRIVFQPYTFKEVHEILMNRLGVLELDIFKVGAMEYLARRASTVAGRYRVPYAVCRPKFSSHFLVQIL